jgi:3-hydroxyisobutyrate dehydrogenase-like beta-hydroxyacid dehydrogenase
MVSRLLAAGHDVSVLARREEVRASLAEEGATVVSTPAEAAGGAEVIVVCLFSDAQLIEVSHGSDGLLAAIERGTTVASHVTGRRATILELAELAGSRGDGFVDAPVSGGDVEINAGKLTVMLGGRDAAVDRAAAVIASYSDPIIRTGVLGSALAIKLVNNLLFTANGQLAAAAVDLARELGADTDALFQVLKTASGGSFAGSSLANRQSAEAWMAVVGEFLRKDVAACAAELADAKIDDTYLLDVVARGPLPLIAAAR